MEPMNELDIRIAAQLAEYGRTLDRLVRKAVQLAEQRDPTDVTHDASAPIPLVCDYRIQCSCARGLASRDCSALPARDWMTTSAASARRSPSQLIHPRRDAPASAPPSRMPGISTSRSSKRTCHSHSSFV